jgi:hypothetical protein
MAIYLNPMGMMIAHPNLSQTGLVERGLRASRIKHNGAIPSRIL